MTLFIRQGVEVMKAVYLLMLFMLLSCSTNSQKNLNTNQTSYQRIQRDYTLDAKVNPCDDFYKHVCNGAINNFTLPSNRSAYVFAFHDSSESLLAYKKNYFKNLTSKEARTGKEASLKTFYQACMNEQAGNQDELAYIKQIKSDLEKIKNKDDLIAYSAKGIETGESVFISYEVMRNQDNSSLNDAMLFPILMTLPEKSYYQNEELKKQYIPVLTSFFEAINETEATEKANFIYQLEKDFADVFPTPLEIRTLLSTRTKITKKQLLKFTNLKLEAFLKALPNKTLIRNITPKAMQFTNDKITSLSVDQMKTIVLYYKLKDVLDDSASNFYKKKFAFENKYLGGPSERSERQERCTTQVMNNFPMELDSILYPEIFPDFPKEQFINIAEKIRSTLIDTLKTNTWLSKKAKAGAIKKMSTAKLYLIAPETEQQWNFNPEVAYNSLTPVMNALNLRKAVKLKTFKEFGKELPKDRWEKGPLEVNAYYQPTFNIFVMPAAILQKPFFDKNQTLDQNLAAVGTVIGHELGHGIDDKGYLYDEVGKLRSWVTLKDKKGLEERSKPLISEFDGIGHNGHLTLGENTGDLVGLSTSFKAAFPAYVKNKYEINRLKEFFIQYGRIWCEVQTPTMAERRLKTDPHSLGYARTNEQVKNQPGFQEAFSCKKGDSLFKDEKEAIKIW